MFYRICPRCGRQVKAGEKCTCRASRQAEAERQKRYDRTGRNKTSYSFYHSVEWERMREEIMTAAHGLDEWMEEHGRMKPAFLVHHIIPYIEAPERALDPLNLVAVSAITHSMIHKQYSDSMKAKKAMQDELFKITAARERRRSR